MPCPRIAGSMNDHKVPSIPMFEYITYVGIIVIWLGRTNVKIMRAKIIFLPGKSNLARPYPITELDTRLQSVGIPAIITL